MIQQDDIKETIINDAQSIFNKFGFKKTTMDEIAQAARKGKSTLYHYFKSKEEIFASVLEKESDIMYRKLNKITISNTDCKTKLKVYIITKMKMIDQLSNLDNAINNDFLDHFPFIQKYRKKFDELEKILLEKILQEGVDRKEFQIEENNIKPFAYSIAIIIRGLETPFFIEKDAKISDLDTIMSILFYGIARE